MALNLKSYANPFDPANPLPTAYAWITSLSLDLRGLGGRVGWDVHPNEPAWTAPPLGHHEVSLGRNGAPTLAELMADPEFAAAYQTIAAKLHAAAIAAVPAFAGASPSTG